MSKYLKFGVAVVLAVAFFYGFIWAQSLTYRIPINAFVKSFGASDMVAAYAYLIGTHTLSVLLAALPIALIIPLVFKNNLLAFALLISVLPVVDILWSLLSEPPSTASQILFMITDIIKFLIFIPFMTWVLLKWLPYNKSNQQGPTAGTP